jgi:hypothetical protein
VQHDSRDLTWCPRQRVKRQGKKSTVLKLPPNYIASPLCFCCNMIEGDKRWNCKHSNRETENYLTFEDYLENCYIIRGHEYLLNNQLKEFVGLLAVPRCWISTTPHPRHCSSNWSLQTQHRERESRGKVGLNSTISSLAKAAPFIYNNNDAE